MPALTPLDRLLQAVRSWPRRATVEAGEAPGAVAPGAPASEPATAPGAVARGAPASGPATAPGAAAPDTAAAPGATAPAATAPGAAVPAATALAAEAPHSEAQGASAPSRPDAGLASLAARGYLLLDHRRVPGGFGTVDHLVVGPTGVWVIEVAGRRDRDAAGDRALPGHGRARTAVDRVLRNVAAVQVAAAAELRRFGVSPRPVICVGASRLPILRRESRGVPLVPAARLAALITAGEARLGAEAVGRLAAVLEEATTPPAGDPR